MECMMPSLRGSAKEKLWRSLRNCREAKLRTRYLIVINLSHGRSPTEIARLLRGARFTVYNVVRRFREWSKADLVDRRESW
ncbi:MAG: helix-turn-helix domain-containing protein [Planctomycetaceae bacterium]